MKQGNPVTCAYSNAYSKYRCERESLKSSKDGYCIFHAKAEDKNEREFKKALKKYIEDGNYDFSGFVFVGDIDFKKDFGVAVFKNASFEGASFQGEAHFWGASFQGEAIFAVTSFQGEAHFGGASFQGEANFVLASFQGGAKFGEASFQGGANFGEASFQGGANFGAASFPGGAHFGEASFQGETYFMEASFPGEANFREASFQGETYFGEVSFRGVANFEEASFQGETYFREASFQGETYFGEVSFRGGADFRGTEFRTRASISLKCMKGYVSLVHAILENISLTPLNLDKDTWIDFTDARLRNTEIRREDIEDHIKQEREKDFSEAKEIYLLLKNNFHSLGRYDDESWAFRKEKEMERKGFWHFRKEHTERELGKEWSNKGIKDCFYPALFYFEYTAKYLQDHWLPTSGKKINKLFSYMANFPKHPIGTIKGELKNFASFVADGKKEEIGNMSYKELFRALWFYIKYPIKYSWSTFLKYLYGWGEQPWLIFLWCGITIFIFSVLYLGGDVIAKDGTLVKSYLDKLYFSGVTFTTLGYGDFSPIGGTRLLAFIESFLGVFFIALFVFSFARRTAGR